MDLASFKCAFCSFYPRAPLCERCAGIVASGTNQGPIPAFALERVPRKRCSLCQRKASTDRADFRMCARHIEEAYEKRVRATPLDFSRPQRPHVVGQSGADRGHYFF